MYEQFYVLAQIGSVPEGDVGVYGRIVSSCPGGPFTSKK